MCKLKKLFGVIICCSMSLLCFFMGCIKNNYSVEKSLKFIEISEYRDFDENIIGITIFWQKQSGVEPEEIKISDQGKITRIVSSLQKLGYLITERKKDDRVDGYNPNRMHLKNQQGNIWIVELGGSHYDKKRERYYISNVDGVCLGGKLYNYIKDIVGAEWGTELIN